MSGNTLKRAELIQTMNRQWQSCSNNWLPKIFPLEFPIKATIRLAVNFFMTQLFHVAGRIRAISDHIRWTSKAYLDGTIKTDKLL